MLPLEEILKNHFGETFPVGAGSTKRDDPLVITDSRDYVSIEYGVAQFLLTEMGFKYEFETQSLHTEGSRVVDELVFAAREAGDFTWTQTRRFFFDITAGYHRGAMPQRDTLKKSQLVYPVYGVEPVQPTRSILGGTQRIIFSVVVGTIVGASLGLMWLTAGWIWGAWGERTVVWLLSSPRDTPAPLLLGLVPAILGALIFGFSLEHVGNWIYRNWLQRLSVRVVIWSAVSICIVFSIAYSAFMFLLAGASSGLSRSALTGYGIVYLALPSAAAVYVARSTIRKMADDAA